MAGHWHPAFAFLIETFGEDERESSHPGRLHWRYNCDPLGVVEEKKLSLCWLGCSKLSPTGSA